MAKGPARVLDGLLVVAFSLVGIGNLVLSLSIREALRVDYFTLALGLSVGVILLRLATVGQRLAAWWQGLLFFALCLPGFLSQDMTPYGVTKLQALCVMLLIIVAASAVDDLVWLVSTLSVVLLTVCSLFSVGTLLLGAPDEAGRLTFLGLNPIGVGRAAGLATILALIYIFASPRKRVRSLVPLLAAASMGVVVVVATGSRGPLVAIGAAFAALLLLMAVNRRMSLRALAVVATVAILGSSFAGFIGGSGLSRILSASDSGRGLLYEESLALALASPLGIGWGRLGQYIVDFGVTDTQGLYPHNVFLEVFVEGGIFALLAVALLVLVSLKRAWGAAAEHAVLTPVLVILIYALVSAQFSSDIVGNRLLWLSIALALSCRRFVAKSESAGSRRARRRPARRHRLITRGPVAGSPVTGGGVGSSAALTRMPGPGGRNSGDISL